VLGSGQMIPGFEDGLVGAKAGDTVTLKLKFPEKYHNADLAGKETKFDVTVNKVSEKIEPELDDEFFSSFGVEEGGIEAFRKEVAANMEREMKSAGRNKVKNKVLDALLENCPINVPRALVESEIDNLRYQALQRMGIRPGQQVDPSLLPDELFRDQARRRVVSGLILGEVIARENLSADPVRVRESVEEIASTYESPDEVVNWYYGNREQLETVESSVLEDQVFDFILGQAKVTEKQVSYEEIIKPEPREEAALEEHDAADPDLSGVAAETESTDESADSPIDPEAQGKSEP